MKYVLRSALKIVNRFGYMRWYNITYCIITFKLNSLLFLSLCTSDLWACITQCFIYQCNYSFSVQLRFHVSWACHTILCWQCITMQFCFLCYTKYWKKNQSCFLNIGGQSKWQNLRFLCIDILQCDVFLFFPNEIWCLWLF